MLLRHSSSLAPCSWRWSRYAFAHGLRSNRFFGYSQFALVPFENISHAVYFFQWTLSAASITVVSGAIAERATFYAYLLYSICFSGFTYPIISHCVRLPGGRLPGVVCDCMSGPCVLHFFTAREAGRVHEPCDNLLFTCVMPFVHCQWWCWSPRLVVHALSSLLFFTYCRYGTSADGSPLAASIRCLASAWSILAAPRSCT